MTGVPWPGLPKMTSLVSRNSSPTPRASALWSITENSLSPLARSSSVSLETVGTVRG